MKIQKTKNEVILNLLERKDLIIDDKIDFMREYQEWVMGAPYKIITLIVVHRIFKEGIKTFCYTINNKWWADLIYKVLLFLFFCITLFFLASMLGSFSRSRIKLPHLDNQLYRTDLKIKEILAKLEEKKEE